MMDGGSDVGVKLTAIDGGGKRLSPHPRVPARIAHVRDKARLLLTELLSGMFDQADDALFEMADRASSNHEQNIYFESMRVLRVERRRMDMLFRQNFDAGFHEIQSRASVQAEPDLATGNLSLVDDSELEEVVAVEGMVARTMMHCSDELSLLSMRFESLLNGICLNNDNNPLSPKAISSAFNEASRGLEVDIKARLFLLKLFEKHVLKELASLYRTLNRDLAEEGVLKNISLADKIDPESASMPSPLASAERGRESAVAGDGSGAGHDGVFAELQGLLQHTPLFSGPGAVGGSVKIVRQALVLELLSRIQAKLPEPVGDEAGYVCELPPSDDIRELVAELLNHNATEGRFELGRVDEDAINLVSLLFQFVLDDDGLALPMKALLCRLQVPMAKVALLDKSFFGKNGHPARKLLNVMAQAGIGWEPAQTASRDFLYRKIQHAVGTVLDRFEDDIGVFQEVLGDFVRFVENERRRASIVERRTLDAEQGRARSEAARRGVATTIAQCTGDKNLHGVVTDLLEHAWSNVLFLIFVREGESSDSWKSAVRTMEELVWSVQPKRGVSERQRLTTLKPRLHKAIREGLARIGFSHFALNHFFEQLETIHQCLLERTSGPVAPAHSTEESAQPPEGETTSAEDAVGADEENGRKSLDEMLSGSAGSFDVDIPDVDSDPESGAAPGDESDAILDKVQGDDNSPPVDEAMLAAVDKLTMGSWVQFNPGGEAHFRCRLAAVMKPTGRYIFVNRGGKKVAEWNREQLAAKVASNIVCLLDDGLLFDRALEAVIAQLQSSRD